MAKKNTAAPMVSDIFAITAEDLAAKRVSMAGKTAEELAARQQTARERLALAGEASSVPSSAFRRGTDVELPSWALDRDVILSHLSDEHVAEANGTFGGRLTQNVPSSARVVVASMTNPGKVTQVCAWLGLENITDAKFLPKGGDVVLIYTTDADGQPCEKPAAMSTAAFADMIGKQGTPDTQYLSWFRGSLQKRVRNGVVEYLGRGLTFVGDLGGQDVAGNEIPLGTFRFFMSEMLYETLIEVSQPRSAANRIAQEKFGGVPSDLVSLDILAATCALNVRMRRQPNEGGIKFLLGLLRIDPAYLKAEYESPDWFNEALGLISRYVDSPTGADILRVDRARSKEIHRQARGISQQRPVMISRPDVSGNTVASDFDQDFELSGVDY